MATVVSDNKKGFFKYVNRKRRSKENIALILDADTHLTVRERKIVRLLMFFF